MIIQKTVPPLKILQWVWFHLMWLTIWSASAVAVYEFSGYGWLMSIPWLPLSLVGTAVAFYVGFKNNSAYDRMWEARKIWGAIVNSSRAWGAAVRGYVSNQFTEQDEEDAHLHSVQQRLVYRHLAWLYALRSQLLVVKEWEHAAQTGATGRQARHYQQQYGVGLIDDEITKVELSQLIPPDEIEQTINFKNTATQIIDRQAQDLKELRRLDLIDDFRHMELQKLLYDFYVHQGKAERIKNFPLPRQYANMSSIFIGIFILLLPFGMATEFANMGEYGTWWSIPFSALVGWVFVMMEVVGDYSENPFQGMANDIPMFSLCRTIEIDLREMLGESDLPPAVASKNGILM
ncbi:MAG: bestrophin family ion channel [Planctomycetota bacterium]